MAKAAKRKQNKGSVRGYLEIYIEFNGRVVLTPVKKEILPFLQRFSPETEISNSIYCG
jgi:hypothetical protein